MRHRRTEHNPWQNAVPLGDESDSMLEYVGETAVMACTARSETDNIGRISDVGRSTFRPMMRWTLRPTNEIFDVGVAENHSS